MFHVPEKNRIKDHSILATDSSAGNNGAFRIKSLLQNRWIWVIASDGSGWEHVSCHVVTINGGLSLPRYEELCYIKDLFWDDEDVIVQYHPKKSNYVNNHQFTLHLWRPTSKELPYPDSLLAGFTDSELERIYDPKA